MEELTQDIRRDILEGIRVYMQDEIEPVAELGDLALFLKSRYGITREQLEIYLALMKKAGEISTDYIGAHCFIIFN